MTAYWRGYFILSILIEFSLIFECNFFNFEENESMTPNKFVMICNNLYYNLLLMLRVSTKNVFFVVSLKIVGICIRLERIFGGENTFFSSIMLASADSDWSVKWDRKYCDSVMFLFHRYGLALEINHCQFVVTTICRYNVTHRSKSTKSAGGVRLGLILCARKKKESTYLYLSKFKNGINNMHYNLKTHTFYCNYFYSPL